MYVYALYDQFASCHTECVSAMYTCMLCTCTLIKVNSLVVTAVLLPQRVCDALFQGAARGVS